MKKIATLLLAMGLVFGMSTGANAIDFKAKGQWIMGFDYGQHMNFAGGSKKTGAGNGEDTFEAVQRIRLQLDAVASESLSGTAYFEIGKTTWGSDGSGGAIGADSNQVVKLKNGYIDWVVPETDLKVRMGIQNIDLPSFTTQSQVLCDDTAGITLSYQFTENVGITAFWARPVNDNYAGPWDEKASKLDGSSQNYMDNIDLFALVLPLTFDGIKVTPWAMIGGIGPNAVESWDKDAKKYSYKVNGGTSAPWLNAGLFPAGGGRHKNGTKVDLPGEYATAWWAGVTGDITMWDPLRIAFDFNYGSVEWEGSQWDRAGWMASALVEYKFDWGIPGIYGWYASGDDGNPGNGSERMPSVSVNNINNGFSNFAFNGHPYIPRETIMARDMSGTWGVGARLKDVSFIENLKHTLRVNLIGGTNSTTMAKRYLSGQSDFMQKDDVFASAANAGALGMNPLYMTTEDYALEVGLTTAYKMYDNFTIYLDANYLATWMDHSKDVWGNSKFNGVDDSTADPWNVNLSFVYAF